jgi:hypothetical protein
MFVYYYIYLQEYKNNKCLGKIHRRKRMSNGSFYVVKCAFSRSDGGPSPAVPLPVPPNDSGGGGTVDGFGVETNQNKRKEISKERDIIQ